MGKKSFIIDLTFQDRIRLRFVTKEGEVKNFIVQYEAYLKNTWHEIVRYDTSHGFLHMDTCHFRKKPIKIKLDISDLNRGLTYAVEDIKARWRNYKEKFSREIK